MNSIKIASLLLLLMLLTLGVYLKYFDVNKDARKHTPQTPNINNIRERNNWDQVNFLTWYFPQFHNVYENMRSDNTIGLEWDYIVEGKSNEFGRNILSPNFKPYDLTDSNVRIWQYNMMEGIFDCIIIYHYWLDNHPVMEKVIELMITDHNLPIFVLDLVNSPWQYRYGEKKHTYPMLYDDPERHAIFLIKYFKHPNYLYKKNRPILLIHDSSNIPTIYLSRLRFYIYKYMSINISFMQVMMESNPKLISGFDGRIEFSPATIGKNNIHRGVIQGDSDKCYHHLMYCDSLICDVNIIPGTLVSWDNTPRHPINDTWHKVIDFDYSPTNFKLHCFEKINNMRACNITKLNVFAWNEWGEGAVFEPTLQYDNDYLEAMRDCVQKFKGDMIKKS